MKHVTKLLLVLVLLSPLSSIAGFKSQKHLLDALSQIGYTNVIEFPGGNGAPNIMVHANGDSVQLERFAHGREKRIAELDYVSNERAFFAKDIYLEAYQVDNLFICYRLPPGPVQNLKKITPRYSTCYLFPEDVREVLYALKAARRIK